MLLWVFRVIFIIVVAGVLLVSANFRCDDKPTEFTQLVGGSYKRHGNDDIRLFPGCFYAEEKTSRSGRCVLWPVSWYAHQRRPGTGDRYDSRHI